MSFNRRKPMEKKRNGYHGEFGNFLQQKDSDKKDEDEEITKDTKLEFQAAAFQCLGEAWPADKDTQDKYQNAFCELLTSNQNKSVWKVEVTILKSLHKFYSRLRMLQDKESVRTNSNLLSSLLQQTIAPLCKSLGNVKYAAIRTEAAALTELLLTTLNDTEGSSVMSAADRATLRDALRQMSSDSQPDLQAKAALLLIALQ